MSGVPGWLLRHRVTVEPYTGETGAGGPSYGPPVEARAMVTEQVREVRDSEGRVTVSTATVITGTGVDCPPHSRITLPSGRVTRALAVASHTAPGLPVPAHQEVRCE